MFHEAESERHDDFVSGAQVLRGLPSVREDFDPRAPRHSPQTSRRDTLTPLLEVLRRRTDLFTVGGWIKQYFGGVKGEKCVSE